MTQESRLCRSMLLVPSSVPRMLEKARTSPADLIVFDLEDSVPAADKEAARANISAARREGAFAARHHAVKINGPETQWCAEDVAFVAREGIDTILLPTDQGWPEIEAVERLLTGTGIRILAAIETPAGLLSLPRIAQEARHVAGLVLGPWDYTMSIGAFDAITGLDSSAGDAHLQHPRQTLLTQARARGWLAVDAPFVLDAKDAASVEQSARRARRQGFDGCITFYPPSVGLFNTVFSPSAAELDWAQEVVRAYDSREPGRTAVVTPAGKTYLLHHYRAATRFLKTAELAAAR